MDPLPSKYREVLLLVEQEFSRNVDLHGDRMQCGRGCSSCCSQMFRITMLDSFVISAAINKMDEESRAALRKRAQDYRQERQRLLDERAHETDLPDDSEIPTHGLRLPCPALIDGACGIYDARPVVCRKWGIPLFDPDQPDRLQACELNFPPGTSIEDEELDELLLRQSSIHELWQAAKHEFRARRKPQQMATTIAEAMLADHEEMLT
jgi:Fe-S-cluster containining protein